MSVALSKATTQSAQDIIAVGLRCSFGDLSLRQSLAADHIRSALYANAVLGAELKASPALHTTRLLTSVRKTLDLVWPGAGTEHLRQGGTTVGFAQQTLDSLSAFGDAVDTGGGFWVGTPLRLIRFENIYCAVGAAPNCLVKSLVGVSPICAGISRFIEIRANPTSEIANVTLSASQWLGAVEELQTWTKRVLHQHDQRMQSGNDIPANQLEIFAPDLLTARQRNPWVPAQTISRPIEGLHLCRPIESYAYAWARPFYLAHFKFVSGELLVSQSVQVDYGITRRLRFGLYCLHRGKQTISANINKDLVELELPLGLPNPEARIAALGWQLPSNQNRFVFHRLAIPLLTEVLGRLGVGIIVR